KDFKGAFKRLPKRLLRLFPQAYQSYLFNKFLSRRLARGLPLNKAEVGDYVIKVDTSGLPFPKAFTIVQENSLHEINDAISKGKMYVALTMVGFKQKLSQGVQGEIEREILEEEDITPEDFKIKSMPELRISGGLRTAITPLKDFSLMEIARDEVNPKKWKTKIGFTLYRGSYATVLLREIMKPRNPVKAGF
ncbi:tRNA pseudouridine(13) synthase TruD, partial [Candidatus Bathyarchaeota archaeon]|nr:tRNA pseudouridine(13) synthase TruD [Candidatus Bathyarchaeota archaeon]